MDIKTEADKYFDGLLSKKERKKFRKKIKNNPEIRDYLDQREFLEAKLREYFHDKENIDKNSENDVKNYLNNYIGNSEREYEFKTIISNLSKKEKKNRFILNPAILNLAAAVALFIIIGLGLSNKFIQNSKQKRYLDLYAQYFEPEEDFYSGHISLNGQDSVKYSFNDTYSPDELNDKFYNIVRSGSYDDESLVYFSVLQLKNENYDLAIIQLKEILQYANPPVSDMACWYFSLANIKLGEKKIAIENLTNLCKGNSEYKEEACELINKIANK
ncbi:MAG: hypothetical protein KAS71_13475 [Bacteroidales bacterium]|nr:hypothetical protein [Bacteroidales bacterium]